MDNIPLYLEALLRLIYNPHDWLMIIKHTYIVLMPGFQNPFPPFTSLDHSHTPPHLYLFRSEPERLHPDAFVIFGVFPQRVEVIQVVRHHETTHHQRYPQAE